MGVLTDFTHAKEPEVPMLHEIWNWEGDKSVLPSKWVYIIQKARGVAPTKEELLHDYIDVPDFDPSGFFFLTKRSKAVGCAIVVNAKGKYTIHYLCTLSKERKVCNEAGDRNSASGFMHSLCKE